MMHTLSLCVLLAMLAFGKFLNDFLIESGDIVRLAAGH
jgi:hypothetical protein